MLIKDLFNDHVNSLIFTNLTIGSYTATDKQWSDVFSLLHSKYKFSLDRNTFAGTLCPDIIVKPKSSKGLHIGDSWLYYVTYDCLHNQDAAVFKMLSISNKIGRESYGDIYPDVSHTLIFPGKTNKINTGIIKIHNSIHTECFSDLWMKLYIFTSKKHTIQNYITFMESL